MSKSVLLRLQDVRALFHVIQECRDLGDDAAAWRRHYVVRLACLTGADWGVNGEVAWKGRGLYPVSGVFWGWQNGFAEKAFAQGAAEHGGNLAVCPLQGEYFRSRPLGACVSRTDLVSERDWRRSEYYGCIHEPVGFGHTLLCALPLPSCGNELNAISLLRPAATRGDFSGRDRLLVQEAQALLAPLVGGPLAGFKQPSPTALSPRVRQVLRCLLEGDGDKQVAHRLGISRHTVNQYTKTIFKHFCVQSRAELMAIWIRRSFGRFSWTE